MTDEHQTWMDRNMNETSLPFSRVKNCNVGEVPQPLAACQWDLKETPQSRGPKYWMVRSVVAASHDRNTNWVHRENATPVGRRKLECPKGIHLKKHIKLG